MLPWLIPISVALLCHGTLAATPKTPNVLWIIAEDMGPELSCYGAPEVHTPHIDGLALQGVRYANAFTVTPVCSTSRSSFMTGMYATTIGAHNHRSHRSDGFQLPEGVKVLTDWLRPAGYFTANIVHLSDDPRERFYRGTGKTDWNFQYTGKPLDSNRWSDLKQNQPLPKPGSVDERLVVSIDWSATTLAIGGVPKPEKMQGRIFLGEQAEPPRQHLFAARDRGDETVFRIRTVRDENYRYLRNFMSERPFLQINRYKEHQYPELRLMRKLAAEGKLNTVQAALTAPSRPAEELYDIKSDPYETKNLAESPEHREVLARMRSVLNNWIEESDDQGRVPEPAEIVKLWEQRMKKTYDAGLKKQAEYEKKHGIQPQTSPR